MTELDENSVEDFLRASLAQGDAVIGSLSPILHHLLANDDNSLFSDEVVARVRGMIGHIARQLLHISPAAFEEPGNQPLQQENALSERLIANAPLVGHLHALALEWQLAERLHGQAGLDPVLSPLLQALIASPDPEKADAAMTALAAQARFMQSARRMELPVTELPGDLFHSALVSLRSVVDNGADAAFRGQYDESRTRIGLFAQLVMGMGGGSLAALSLSHAGVAIFLSALAMGSEQGRDMATLATNERQASRLVLALRAAGLKPDAADEQFLMLHGAVPMPKGITQVGRKRAAKVLAASAANVAE